MKHKFKIIFLPFLLANLATLLGYGLFRWVFDLQLNWIHLKEDLWTFWIPFALSGLVVALVLRNRIKILNIHGSRGNGYFFYQLIGAGIFFLPMLNSQHFLQEAAYDLVRLQDVSELTLPNHHPNRFYQIQNFQVDAKQAMGETTARTTGRNNESLHYNLYLSTPFITSTVVNDQVPRVWYGVKYRHSLKNSAYEEEKQDEYSTFVNESIEQFDTFSFQEVVFFENLAYSDDWDGYVTAVKNRYPEAIEDQLFILEARNEPFDKRGESSKKWMVLTWAGGILLFLTMVLIPSLNPDELERHLENEWPREDEFLDVIKFLIPHGDYFTTALLIDLNLLVFIAMVLSGVNVVSPTGSELLEWGGNRRTETLSGDWWRLLSSTFVHGGLMHIAANLVGLVWIGILLEPILKKWRLLLVYLVTGMVASLASLYWYENTVSIGASGAIFGLFGLLLLLLITRVIPRYQSAIFWLILVINGGFSLFMGFVGSADNAAHIGGLIAGIVVGAMLVAIDHKKLKKNIEQ